MSWSTWGSHYTNGSLVLASVDGELRVMVATKHSGDFHHQFMGVAIEDNEGTPRDHDHLVGLPDDIFNGYYVGPKVGQLNPSEMMMLATGIDVMKLKVTATVDRLTNLARNSPSRAESRTAR